jgi:hypothetical protein
MILINWHFDRDDGRMRKVVFMKNKIIEYTYHLISYCGGSIEIDSTRKEVVGSRFNFVGNRCTENIKEIHRCYLKSFYFAEEGDWK